MNPKAGKNKTIHRVISIICCVIIVGICIWSTFMNHSSRAVALPDKLVNGIPLLFVGIFAMAGIYSLIDVFTSLAYRIKNCKYVTEAVCAELDAKYSEDSDSAGGSWVYTPVYEFKYNGQNYRVKNDAYVSKVFAPKEGTAATIHVDINDEHGPGDYYIGNPFQGITAKFIVGLVFTIPAVWMFIVLILGYAYFV